MNMAKVYAQLIFKGIKTINEVPLKIRAQVAIELQKLKEANT